MNIITKPGLYKQADNNQAEIIYVNETRKIAFGFNAVGASKSYRLDGLALYSHASNNIVEPWPEPRYRPWNLDEVPVGALYRPKDKSVTVQILAVFPYNDFPIRFASWVRLGGIDGDTLKSALEGREHSLDGGKTWIPCGVLVT